MSDTNAVSNGLLASVGALVGALVLSTVLYMVGYPQPFAPFNPLVWGNLLLGTLLAVTANSGVFYVLRSILADAVPPATRAAIAGRALIQAFALAGATAGIFFGLAVVLEAPLLEADPVLGTGVLMGAFGGLLAMLVTDLKERFADAAANELRAQRDTIRTLRTELTPELLDEALALALERLPEQPDEARTVLEHTQELLTYARSSRAAGTQPLYAEIDATQSYFALARLQYGDRFTVNTDIPTALYDVPVAGFTVQPLAAHTLHHRLRTDEADTCTLTIRARSNDAMICLAVTDDGPSFSEDVEAFVERSADLADLQERLQELYAGRGEVMLTPEGLLVCTPLDEASTNEP
ncbi:hypothetical protein [Salisaeta longa]|uniref:hypothetical protein n=1 Tax=Salisaeta longa TaxID=503170 RepID=UPI0003B39915|nr:hypothetical protein [Salisaeta longa]